MGELHPERPSPARHRTQVDGVPRDFGERTANIIDEEVQKLLFEADLRAFDLLQHHRPELDRIVDALLENEELDRKEIQVLLDPETRAIKHTVDEESPARPLILAPAPAVG